ncbi:MAG TPA: alanine--tRNA ligase [Bryobacteraceae bacterium]|nr:alanine--tRNA ligase [Bryobacteraceae bacterium]
MTGHEIRQKFLDFFAERAHRPVRSSSLVPHNDPTLLFTNAGMNQFKDVFLGVEKRDYSRATSSQKCVRAGGKHNDLENVGYTRRHHTFFEMLGNFSFGDYFKAEAIEFAWDLLTKDYALPKDKLYVTVFREDDEAEELWQKIAGVPKSRIFRLDEKDNFWQMGETGPCGPCSEIHFDYGPEAAAPGREHEQFPDDGGGRFVEIWNLVFMQYDRSADGVLTPLPRPSIDTGMGLERVAAVLQGKLSNYETDLLWPIIEHAAELFHVEYGESDRIATTLRICADHARAASFLINDGVIPSNEGRGYVLRKIMRRAMRNARMVGVQEPFLHKLTSFVADYMKPAYPEMLESMDRVARLVREEELRYANTFQVAERVFHDEAKGAQGGVLGGAAAFKLYDTFGLAIDEQEEMAREFGLQIDREGFDSEMDRQRERARASWKGGDKTSVAPVYQDLHAQSPTKFLGYDSLDANATVAALVLGQAAVDELPANTEAEVILSSTPFYAEAGGQVGDQGALYDSEGAKLADVTGTYAPVKGLNVHRIRTVAPMQKNASVRAVVDPSKRMPTMRNHTATHLLHAALRDVLGKHVKQAGSVVEPSRLRFDFTHYASLDPVQLKDIERLVNEQILANAEMRTDVMSIDEALKTGAMALFGEKYGEHVRVVSVGDGSFSRELCGGTHVRRTGDIGVCKVVHESSISAGVRRIEAFTGDAVVRRLEEDKTGMADQIDKLTAQTRALEKQIDQLKSKLAHSQVAGLEGEARTLKGVKVLAARVDGLDRQQLRELADSLRNKWKTGIVVLASAADANVAIISAVTKDLTGKVHAGKLAGSVAAAVGGKGGGRPDMAEAGGSKPEALASALEQAYSTVEGML